METRGAFKVGVFALGLLLMPVLAQAQDRGRDRDQNQNREQDREHRQLDMQNLPSPMETLRNIQNTGRMFFTMTDANHDGQISQKEAIDANNLLVGGFFFRADLDGNGTLSQEEARTVREEFLHQNPWMRYVVETIQSQQKNRQNNNNNNSQGNPLAGLVSILDSNNDKQISGQELRQLVQTATQTYFAAADTNHDGQINPSEVNAAVAGSLRAMSTMAFQQADTDGNGQLSKAEYDKAIVQPASTVFQVLDLNHDGQLSQQESQRIAQGVVSRVRMFQFPEPENSPTNLIESGRLPRDVSPVPNVPTPNSPQNKRQRRQAGDQPNQPQ